MPVEEVVSRLPDVGLKGIQTGKFYNNANILWIVIVLFELSNPTRTNKFYSSLQPLMPHPSDLTHVMTQQWPIGVLPEIMALVTVTTPITLHPLLSFVIESLR